MRKAVYPLVVFLAVLVCVLTARADHSTGAGETGKTPTSGTHKRLYLSPAEKSSGSIHGRCSVVESLGNPIVTACVNQLLILTDEQGNEIERTRSSSEGRFAFSGKAGMTYRILPGSKLYEVSAPEHPFKGGSNVDLKLKAK